MKKLLLCIMLSSCVATTPQIIEKEKPLSPFPITPSVEDYSRKPIISKQGSDFTVSDEFVANSIKYKQYSDKITDWKKLNNIK